MAYFQKTLGEVASDLQPLDLSSSPEYAAALEELSTGVSSTISDAQAPGESWTDTLQRILPVLAATYQQKQILSIQLERAKNGLPPLPDSQFGVGVNVALSPELKTALLIGGALLVFVLMQKR